MKVLHRGYIYEVYSNENSSLLRYAKDDSVDLYELGYLFRDWMSDNKPAEFEEYDSAGNDWDDPEDMMQRFPDEIKEFGEALNNGLYHNEPERYGDTKSSMSLNSMKLLPRTTWLIHFSNDASGIAQEGFVYGASDISKLALTTHRDDRMESEGFNFAFIANSRDSLNVVSSYMSKQKYGKDAVMFMGSGVHFQHSGDEEHQIVFYGPDVKEFALIKDIDGTYCVMGNQSYTAKDYLYMPQSNGLRDSLQKCMEWVITNSRQYSKVLLWNIS